jgi:hypothetical protein
MHEKLLQCTNLLQQKSSPLNAPKPQTGSDVTKAEVLMWIKKERTYINVKIYEVLNFTTSKAIINLVIKK